jgi:Tol biopolymer transport system component
VLARSTADYPTGAPRVSYRSAVWSPDHRRIAYDRFYNDNSDIWMMRADGTHKHQLTHTPGVDVNPVWSPDGRRIAWQRFTWEDHVHTKLLAMRPDGTHKLLLTNESAGDDEVNWGATWSPDASRIAFTSYGPNDAGNLDIYWVDSRVGGRLHQVTDTPEYELDPVWSPRWNTIAFHQVGGRARDVGRLGIVQAQGGTIRYLADNVLAAPRALDWRPDGRRLAFQAATGGVETRIVSINPSHPRHHRFVTPPTLIASQPVWSPSGRRLAFDGQLPPNYRAPGAWTITIGDAEATRLTRFYAGSIDW